MGLVVSSANICRFRALNDHPPLYGCMRNER